MPISCWASKRGPVAAVLNLWCKHVNPLQEWEKLFMPLHHHTQYLIITSELLFSHPSSSSSTSSIVIKVSGSHIGKIQLGVGGYEHGARWSAATRKQCPGLHKKKDTLINCTERAAVLAEGNTWRSKLKGVVNLQIHWVPGHSEFAPNEKADEEAKKAVQGGSSGAKFLPKFLCKHLPLSISVLQQGHTSKLKKCWERRWKDSPRVKLLKSIDNTTLAKSILS